MAPAVKVGKVDPVEAIDFLRRKANLPSQAWTDLKEGAHARAFVVAGATKDQLVSDFHGALVKALKDGTTKADFQKAFDAIAARHGWDFNGGRTWRAGVIYNTNMRMARAAGHWQQIERRKAEEAKFGRKLYLRYVAVMDERTRDDHKQWHGTVLPADHPWWSTHTPPNGWGCRCTVESLTERDLKRYGYTPSEQAPPVVMEDRQVTLADGSTEVWPTPAGIDTGFGSNVGQSWLSGVVPMELQNPMPAAPRSLYDPGKPPSLPLPPIRPLPSSIKAMPDGLPDQDYVKAFLGVFGGAIGKPVAFRDAAGHVLGISDDLFKDKRGALKIKKRDRHLHTMHLAEALKDPDEIWAEWIITPRGNRILKRRYLRRMPGSKGQAFAVFEWDAKGWHGKTVFDPEPPDYLDDQRRGVLLYRAK